MGTCVSRRHRFLPFCECLPPAAPPQRSRREEAEPQDSLVVPQSQSNESPSSPETSPGASEISDTYSFFDNLGSMARDRNDGISAQAQWNSPRDMDEPFALRWRCLGDEGHVCGMINVCELTTCRSCGRPRGNVDDRPVLRTWVPSETADPTELLDAPLLARPTELSQPRPDVRSDRFHGTQSQLTDALEAHSRVPPRVRELIDRELDHLRGAAGLPEEALPEPDPGPDQ